MEKLEHKNEKKINLKLALTILFVLTFLASLSAKCIEFSYSNTTTSIDLFEIRGVQITIMAIIIYLYALYTKKKALRTISITILILAFIYTTYIFFNVNSLLKTTEEIVKNYINLKEGIAFYYISHLILFISLIIPEKDSKQISQSTNTKETYGLKDNDNYVLADYIYGIEKRPDLYKKLAVLATKEEIDNLEINIIDSNDDTRIIIPKVDIKSITVSPSVVSKESMSTTNYGPIENARDIIIFGGVMGALISSVKKDKINDYYKMETKAVYDILIVYQNETGEEKRIMFQTKEKPDEFLKLFKEKYKNV